MEISLENLYADIVTLRVKPFFWGGGIFESNIKGESK